MPAPSSSPDADPADACKRHACDLQRCLKRHSFDAAKCGAVVDALKACCAVDGRMGVSVHCPASAAGWTNEARH